MIIGLPKESDKDEARVGLTPDAIRKLCKKGFQVWVESCAGLRAGFPDREYQMDGVQIKSADEVWGSAVILKVRRPSESEVQKMKKGCLLISFLETYQNDGLLEKLAQSGISSVAIEAIPRTSRAQSMDALSSQANIAGYRAVIEAARHYPRFFPLMMTSAGSSKAAKVVVLGAGVAGLQAIATARRLGAVVEAFDIRSEVKEQILSLGAKFIELDVGEEGAGQGGYARELSEEGKKRQQALLTERLKKFDIIISTANIPGRKAPVLITEEAVRGMRPGSVIVDMAAGNGGNCSLSVANETVIKHDVTLVGTTNFPSLMPADASGFYAQNLSALLNLMVETEGGQPKLKMNLDDDIVAAALVTHQGELRLRRT